MSQYVVDANVAAKWFVPERLSEEALRLLREFRQNARAKPRNEFSSSTVP